LQKLEYSQKDLDAALEKIKELEEQIKTKDKK
jgi:hypothetical protein